MRYSIHMSKFLIYALLCPRCNCPRYVGQTCQGLTDRYYNHLRDNPQDGSTHKKNWVKSLQKQGLQPKIVVLLELPNADYLNEAEIFWIAEMKRRGFPLTNITEGGGGLRGYKWPDEFKRYMSEKFKGRPIPEEQRRKISQSLMGNIPYNKGKKLTGKAKEAHRLLHDKPIKDENGNIYSSVTEASLKLGIQRQNISKVLHGTRNTVGGHYFSFLDEPIKIPVDKRFGERPPDVVERASAPRRKPIVDQNGVVYPGVNAAARQLGLSPGNIVSVLKGVYKQTGGYIFKYFEE